MTELFVEQIFEDLKDELQFELLTSNPDGLRRSVDKKALHRPGLALAGYIGLFAYDRIQVLGNTEISYLHSVSSEERHKRLEVLRTFDIPCMVITNQLDPPQELVDNCNERGIAILRSQLDTTSLYHLLSIYLDDFFAPTTQLHGTLVDVYGTGLLLTGKSGIGKSEVALDLVERGHRLVADDIVRVTRKAGDVLMGQGNEMLQHFMEVRGLGILDIRQLFGIKAVRMQKRLEMIVELRLWEERDGFERVGLDHEEQEILGITIPLVQLPIFPGKNITVLCETLAMNLHLQVYGYDSAQEFNNRLLRTIEDKRRLKRYLRRDTE